MLSHQRNLNSSPHSVISEQRRANQKLAKRCVRSSSAMQPVTSSRGQVRDTSDGVRDAANGVRDASNGDAALTVAAAVPPSQAAQPWHGCEPWDGSGVWPLSVVVLDGG